MDEWNFLKYDSSLEETLNKFKKAAKVHKKVRKNFRTLIDSGEIKGMKYFDIANHIEGLIEKDSKFVAKDPFKSGIGFPIGLSINECAAHWTPNPGEKRILKKSDLVKVDYGVHYDGCIIDSAFTFCLDNKYDELIKIGKGATNLAIKNSGVDAILGEIGAETQEFIESHEVEIDGKVHQVKSVRDLTGHMISPYMIHSKKSVPNIKIDYPVRMEENEFYAIETFPTTGNGKTTIDLECSHYMINTDKIVKEDKKPPKLDTRENFLFKRIRDTRQTLPFCKKWLKNYEIKGYQIPLNSLVKKGVVNSYPPIMSQKDSVVVQFEHTIFIGEKGVKILSKGDDY